MAIVLLFGLPAVADAQSALMSRLLTAGGDANDGVAPVSLVVESDTYVPYFYHGRREPSAGNQTRMIVVGEQLEKAVSFQWQIGSERRTSTEPVITFTFPYLMNELLVTVNVLGANGSILGKTSEYVRASRPKIVFYESNALRGLSRVAAGDTLTIIGPELSLRAEPYFIGVDSLPAGARGTWKTGRNLLNLSLDSDWRSLTLVKKDAAVGGESDQLQLSITSLRNPREVVSDSIKLDL